MFFPSKPKTKILLKNKTISFGNISIKDSVNSIFFIENIGDAPLKIDTAIASCGCTGLKWTKTAVLPGKSAEINVTFKPTPEASDDVHKSIVIEANTNERFHVLYISGKVIKD